MPPFFLEGKMDRMEAQKNEFDKLSVLAEKFKQLPAVVDDDYPEARHYYESALKDFIDALVSNGRI